VAISDFASLLDESIELAGLNPAKITARHIASIQTSLDLLFIDLENKGANAEFRQATKSLTVPANTSVVGLPSDVIDVSQVTASATTGSYATLSRTNREAWLQRADRSQSISAGFPSSYWLSKSMPQDTLILTDNLADGWASGTWASGTTATTSTSTSNINTKMLVLWPACAAQTVLTISYIRQIASATALGDTIDAQRPWLPTIAIGLAARIAQKYNRERYADLINEFDTRIANREQDQNMHPVMIGFRGFGFARGRRH
jgi:hypothetical protein